MAFGKPTETRRVKNAVLEDTLYKTYILTEEKNTQQWKNKWNWLLDEYDDLHKKLQEISKDSQFLSDVNKSNKGDDHRTVKPIPLTTNHQYGWIASLPDFRLDKFDPDYDRGAPLPASYHIFKEHLKYQKM